MRCSVTISTDYVFDGLKTEGFYTQRDNPRPINVYGRFKLEGERLAQAEHARTIVVRAGYIFGLGGKNFLSTVVTRARQWRTVDGDRRLVWYADVWTRSGGAACANSR